MWTLVSESLPDIPTVFDQTAGVITYGVLENDFAPAYTIFSKLLTYVVKLRDETPEYTTDDGVNVYKIDTTLNIDGTLRGVTLGSSHLTEADSISSIGDGQYYYDPSTGAMYVGDIGHNTVKPTGDLNTLNISADDGNNVSIPSTYINPSLLPSILYSLPVTGQITISTSFEGHPSSSFVLKALSRNLPQIRRSFIPGTEITMFGIGFRVSTYSEKPDPKSPALNREYDITVNLGGKWENYTNKPCYLRENATTLKNLADPITECTATNVSTQVGFNWRTIQSIARQVNVPVIGDLPTVSIPTNTPALATTNWPSLIEERARIKGSFIDYSRADAVYLRSIYSNARWDYNENNIFDYSGISISAVLYTPSYIPPINLSLPEISHDNLPTTIQSPVQRPLVDEDTSIIPYAEDYKSVQLTGTFKDRLAGLGSHTSANSTVLINPGTEASLQKYYVYTQTPLPTEDAQNKNAQNQMPKWRRKEPSRLVLTQGDSYPDTPPKGTIENLFPREQYHLSLNFDSSGPTKTLTVSTSEDGSPISEEVYTYGFIFTASEIGGMNEEIGELVTPESQASFWKLVQYQKTVYNYQTETGYALGSTTTGWKYSRFKQENDSSPETITLPIELRELGESLADAVAQGDSESAAEVGLEIIEKQKELKLYHYEIISINSATRYYLRSFLNTYGDNQTQSPYERVEICLPSGTKAVRYVPDPNYVDPMYVLAESSENITFKYTLPPEIPRLLKENQETNIGRAEEGLGPLPFVPPPPLVTGEETYLRRTLNVIPKSSILVNEGNPNEGSSPTDRDLYIEYTAEFNSLDPGFKSSVTNTRYSEKEGRPPVASRKPITYEKLPPDDDDGRQVIKSVVSSNLKGDYKILLSTPGFETYPETGSSVSFEAARTFEEALNAASSTVYVNNILNSLSSSITVNFSLAPKIFDKVVFNFDSVRYKRRITGITYELELTGLDPDTGAPLVSGHNVFSLGLDRDIYYNLRTVNIPKAADPSTNKPDKAPNGPLGLQDLGEILPLDLTSRLNLRQGLDS